MIVGTPETPGWMPVPRPQGPQEDMMLAIAAAVVFGLAFLLNLLGSHLQHFSSTTFILLGLLLLALHFAGVGVGGRVYSRR